MAHHRIASLLPAATEIVAECGFAGQLVGRSHDSDYPARVGSVPVVTAPRISRPMSSPRAADGKDLLQAALSIYQVELDSLKELKPDIVITQCLTRELNIPFAEVSKALSDYLGQECKLVSIAPESMDEVMESIEVISFEVGAPHKGVELVKQMTLRLEKTKRKLEKLKDEPKPTVLALENFAPPTSVGQWIPEMISLAGGYEPFGAEAHPARILSWEQIAELDPDLLLMIPYGLDLYGAGVAVRNIHQNEYFRTLRAFRRKQVYVLNGSSYFNRPAPRLVQGFEILAEVLHPRLFPAAYMGTGWAEYF
ncbi:MAG: ABC transporter substrate-binding protein [Bacteroidetes bacterium]|jgi:iron complex transport system substrate-binding protein|nr:ABC transporter substrate-binding protein [Bacteroidota bacterium]